MNNKNKNPLFAPQKDKAGGWTFDKYDYQYHWALYEVLSRHKERKEYAVFSIKTAYSFRAFKA